MRIWEEIKRCNLSHVRAVAAAKAKGLPIPARAVEHDPIRDGVATEGQHVFDINRGE